jgi:hypothetical protein
MSILASSPKQHFFASKLAKTGEDNVCLPQDAPLPEKAVTLLDQLFKKF